MNTENEKQFRAAYALKLAAAIEHPTGSTSYAYGVDAIPRVIDKMIPAFVNGTAEVGSAAKSAARALGVKPTLKGIQEYLTAPETTAPAGETNGKVE